MFDLFRSRDKLVRIMLGGLLLVVAFSMLTYLVPNYNTGGGSASDTLVAEIGSQTITLPQMQRTIQLTVRGRQLPVEVLPNYIPQLVDNMVTERAMVMEAERLGLKVSDTEVVELIRQTVPSLFPDGKFVGKDVYAGMLAQNNMTIDEFEADLRRQVLITRLRDIAVEGTIVTPQEIEQAFHKKYDKIKVEYVKLNAANFTAESQPTAQEVKDFYTANTARYMVPEMKSLTVLIGDQAKLEATLVPTDADLQRMYAQNAEGFRTPERVRARHILLNSPKDDPAVKAKAEALLKQIKGGADFAKLAKENSQDPGSAANGGDLGQWITHGQMVPEFEKSIFSLKPGETSEPVKTQFGYHIIQTLEHQNSGVRSFAEVKDELAAQWKKQRAADLMQQIADKAPSALQKDPMHPDKVAGDFHMQLLHLANYAPGGAVGELGPSGDFDSAVAPLKTGQVSAAVTSGTKVVVAVVDGVVPSRPSPLSDVEASIRTMMANNRSTAAVQKHAQELLTKARAMGGDLEKAAKEMNLTVATSNEIDRNGKIEGLGSASYVSEGFSRPDGSVFGPVGMPDGNTIVAKVIGHVSADAAQLAAERPTLRDQIKSERARDRNTLFETGVKDMLIKQGKIKIHQDVINRLIASYRTS
jgi:peptidyl-prolyl cis-trans isomerase D